MRELPTTAAHRHGVFTLAEAHEGGWSSAALGRAVDRNEVRHFAPGLFAAASVNDSPDGRRHRLRAAPVAACLRAEPAVASHLSAAVLAGLPTWTIPARPCVTVAGRSSGDTVCAHLHRARLPADHILDAAVRRKASARTVIDIAREHGIEDAVVVGDAALRSGRTNLRELERVVGDCARWPGVRRARGVLPLLDGRAESPLESVSRLCINRLHLPAPVLQPIVVDEFGVVIGRVDFYWPDFGVVGEADGRDKYGPDALGAFRHEKWRQEQLEDTGLIVVRWGRRETAVSELLRRKLVIAFSRDQARHSEERRWRIA